MHPATYRAVFFDLDGTLLPIDTYAFMRSYFAALGAYFSREGFDGGAVLEGVQVGTKAMFAFDGATTNDRRFWTAFDAFAQERLDPAADWPGLFERFYEEVFPTLGAGVEADPAAARAVDLLREKGYRLALTTNPLFPPQATACRLGWTGVDAGAFERVTAYHNSRYAKPSPEYYAENLQALGLRGDEVLMVGNDAVEDGAACELGCNLFLVTDHLVEHPDAPGAPEGTRSGSMADFLSFVEGLPAVDGAAGASL